jgi:hypothetical protein
MRKLLVGGEEDASFDTDIIIHINSVFFILNQLGVGPETGFFITGTDELWSAFLVEKRDIEAVKTYVYLKVRLIFDPPTSAFVVEAMERQIREFEWRLNTQTNQPTEVSTT